MCEGESTSSKVILGSPGIYIHQIQPPDISVQPSYFPDIPTPSHATWDLYPGHETVLEDSGVWETGWLDSDIGLLDPIYKSASDTGVSLNDVLSPFALFYMLFLCFEL